MKEIMVGVVLMVATATPGFAQAYCACWGTGNVIDQPLLEKTNGAYGNAMSVPRTFTRRFASSQGSATHWVLSSQVIDGTAMFN
jgi:hypothetical protein